MDLVDDLDAGPERNADKKKISYDIMNDLKPKNFDDNFASISKDVTHPAEIENKILGTQELPQKITSKELIDVNPQNEMNQMGFMNTNGAEISHIMKNPNDVSQNMTNLDILGMPSGKTNTDMMENGQVESNILGNQPPANTNFDDVLMETMNKNEESKPPQGIDKPKRSLII